MWKLFERWKRRKTTKLIIPHCTDFLSSYWSGEMSKGLPSSWDVVKLLCELRQSPRKCKIRPYLHRFSSVSGLNKNCKRGLKGPPFPGLYLLRRAKRSPDRFLFIQSRILVYAGFLHPVMPFLKTWLPRLLQQGEGPEGPHWLQASMIELVTWSQPTWKKGWVVEAIPTIQFQPRELQTFVRMEEGQNAGVGKSRFTIYSCVLIYLLNYYIIYLYYLALFIIPTINLFLPTNVYSVLQLLLSNNDTN